MKTKICCILMLYCFLIPPLIGQQQAIISAAGTTSEMEDYSLDWTIGELAVSSFSFADQLFTEGFHQADPNLDPIVFTAKEAKLSIHCYPNPFQNSITVSWQKELDSNKSQLVNLECVVTNVYGREIRRQKLSDGPIQFDLSAVAVGIYFIHLENSISKERQTQKLIKIK